MNWVTLKMTGWNPHQVSARCNNVLGLRRELPLKDPKKNVKKKKKEWFCGAVLIVLSVCSWRLWHKTGLENKNTSCLSYCLIIYRTSWTKTEHLKEQQQLQKNTGLILEQHRPLQSSKNITHRCCSITAPYSPVTVLHTRTGTIKERKTLQLLFKVVWLLSFKFDVDACLFLEIPPCCRFILKGKSTNLSVKYRVLHNFVTQIGGLSQWEWPPLSTSNGSLPSQTGDSSSLIGHFCSFKSGVFSLLLAPQGVPRGDICYSNAPLWR